jgi:uncharacterized protein related to proFAR isomerase
MKIIPLITIKKGEILISDINKNIKITLDKYKDKTLYLYDIDGINRNKPNLCLFQKLSKAHELWVDAGPRSIGDIVDAIVSGASKITIRLDLFDLSDILSINEILENEIYLSITDKNNSKNIDRKKNLNILKLVNNEIINKIESKYKNFLDFLDKESYIYISSKKSLKKIKQNISGYIIDIEKVEEYKNIGI